jgi:Tol biopolymer transport system component
MLLASSWPAAVSAEVPLPLVSATVKAAAMLAAGEAVTASLISERVSALMPGTVKARTATRVVSALLFSILGITVLGIGIMLFFGHQDSTERKDSLLSANSPSKLKIRPQPEAPPGKHTLSPQIPNHEKPASEQKPNMPTAVQHLADQLKKHQGPPAAGKDGLSVFMIDLAQGSTTLVAAELDQKRSYCGSPSWSSDGQRICFDASPAYDKWDQTHLHMLEATGQGVALRDLGPGNCPTLSPQGDRLACFVNPGAIPGARPGLYVMKADGTERRWLGGSGYPKWSPDGRQLLVFSFTNPCELKLFDVETRCERLVHFPGYKIYSAPSWADEESIVAVVRAKNETTLTIALIDVGNRSQAKIKKVLWRRGDGVEVEPAYPVYSPATGLCFFVGREKKGMALYALEPGNTPRALEPGQCDGKIASLSLSPDGQFLLFCSDRP